MAEAASTGGTRLPSGEPRKVSQRASTRPGADDYHARAPGRPIRWRDGDGLLRRDVDGEHTQVMLGADLSVRRSSRVKR